MSSQYIQVTIIFSSLIILIYKIFFFGKTKTQVPNYKLKTWAISYSKIRSPSQFRIFQIDYLPEEAMVNRRQETGSVFYTIH